MVQLLLLKGADKDASDRRGWWTPLFSAANQGHLATVQALLAAGADTDSGVAQTAACMGHVEILRAVIEHGADVGASDGGHTVLHLAAIYNRVEAIHVLVGAGANIDARVQHSNRTPLHEASVFLRHEAMIGLLELGATVICLDKSLQTPLMLAAAKAGQAAAEVVDALLRAGADETLVDKDGKKASDVIRRRAQQVEGRLVEDVERVREPLANAPAERAWRRRGYLVLCRAHPDMVQNNQLVSGTQHTDTTRMTLSRAKVARAGEAAGDTKADEVDGGELWAIVVAKVLRLQEEGIFRTIVGFL